MQIIGHRGARGEAPENTLSGFEYLKSLGIYAVEFDVRQLQDDQLVVIHDNNMQRTAGVSHVVEELTLEQAKTFNHTHLWQDWGRTEATPTLSEVLNICKDFTHLEVEVKAVASIAHAERLIDTLEQQLKGLESTTTITSFDLQILQTLHTRQSTFRRGLLVQTPLAEHAIDIALQHGCSRIGWKDALASTDLIKSTMDAGLQVSVWTVNDVERAKALQELGIDGLITDVPKLMLEHLSL